VSRSGKKESATITISVDGRPVATASDRSSPWQHGLAGFEAGAFTDTWPQAQYGTCRSRGSDGAYQAG